MRMKPIWQVLGVAALFMVTSCVNQRTTYLPNGELAYAISCKGFLDSWQSCLIKAGRICGTRGYRAVRSEEYDRELLVTCERRRT